MVGVLESGGFGLSGKAKTRTRPRAEVVKYGQTNGPLKRVPQPRLGSGG